MVALEAKYHAKCLLGCYTLARKAKAKGLKSTGEEEVISRITFAEQVMYIEEVRYLDEEGHQYSNLVIWHSFMCHK